MLMELLGIVDPKHIVKYIAIGCLAMSGSILIDITHGDPIFKAEHYFIDEELTNEEE